MEDEKADVIFVIENRNEKKDLRIPLDISATELFTALNTAYSLGIDTADIKNCVLKSERPIALLKGSKTLKEFGIRNGSIIYV